MLVAPLALAALAVLLAWPVPILLARAAWPRRSPAVALILWQSIALAGGLSMIGALLTLGLLPFGDHLIAGIVGAVAEPRAVDFWHVLALCSAVLLGGHLLLNLALTFARAERDRRRHATLVRLLSSIHDSGARLLDTAAPVAYCLPGPLRSITVLSAGLVDLLVPEELDAVIAHERAHVRQRHDLVLIAFRAWSASLPWFPIAYRAEREVGTLVEMLADDDARGEVDDRVLARAIVLVGSASAAGPNLPALAPETAPDVIRARVLRLSSGRLPLAAEAALVAVAAALLAVPTALLLAPAVIGLI